jgi:hypothetical protein
MERDGTGRRFGFSEVVSKHRLHGFSSLGEVVVRNLGEEMMYHVSSNVVVDFVENTEIAVNGGETSTHVGPFRSTVPRDFLFRVGRAMVMEVGDGVEPHDEYPVRENIELKHSDRAESESAGGEETDPGHLESVGSLDQGGFRGGEERGLGVVVRSLFAGGAVQEVEGISEKGHGV